MSIGVSGVNKTIIQPSVGVSGAWKVVLGGWIGVSGVWKLIHALVALTNVSPTFVSANPADSFAGYRLNSAGTVHKAEGSTLSFGASLSTWLLGGAASDYEVRATVNSGSLSTGTAATWQALSTTREWSRSRSVNTAGVDTVNLTIEIRLASSGTVIATCTVVLTAEVA
jgi:hypothetical protein